MIKKVIKNIKTKKACKACPGGKLSYLHIIDEDNKSIYTERCSICGYEQSPLRRR